MTTRLDEHGIAQRGLLVRHLVLPDNLAGSDQVLDFIARKISRSTYLNLMDQYHPCYRADKKPPLDRSLHDNEFQAILALAKQYELRRLDHRPDRYRRAL